MKRTVSIIALALLVLAALPTFATAGESLKDVLVRNTADNPVIARLVGASEVSGTVNVGNLPATQQVTGSVSISNLPGVQQVSGTVEQAAQTVRIARGALDVTQPSIALDVAAFRTVRITARTNSLLCDVPEAEIFVNAPYNIDRFRVPSGGDASRLIELPGTEIVIVNGRASNCTVFVEVFGRAN